MQESLQPQSTATIHDQTAQPTTQQQIPAQPTFTKRNKLIIIGGLFLGATLLIGGVLVYSIYSSQRISLNESNMGNEQRSIQLDQDFDLENNSIPEQSSVEISQIQLNLKSNKISQFDANYNLPTGFKVYIPDNWLASVSAQDTNFFSSTFSILQDNDKNNLTISVESGEKSQIKQSELVEFENSEELMINNLPVTLSVGKETIGAYVTQIYQFDYLVGTKLMRVKFPFQEKLPQSVFDFLKSVTHSQLVSDSTSQFSFISQVFASDDLLIADFPSSQFKILSIMSDPLPARLEVSTQQYKNEKADLYKVKVIKGQQLNILAEKDQDTGFQDSLLIDVFQEDGSMYNSAGYAGDIGWTQDLTIIEKGYSSTGNYDLQAPYTGDYYFIIYSGCGGPEGSCPIDSSLKSQLKSYSMKEPCSGQGEYKSAYVTCLNGDTQWINLETCTQQQSSIWTEKANNICGLQKIDDRGAYLLKVFDKKQVKNIYGVKYEDGSERVINHYQDGSNNIGNKPFGIVVRYPTPVDIVQDGLIRHYDVSSDFSPSKGLMRKAARFYKIIQDQETFLAEIGSAPEIENNPTNMKVVKTYRLGTNTVLYMQTDGSFFPAQHHVGLLEIDDDNEYKSIQRFFSF